MNDRTKKQDAQGTDPTPQPAMNSGLGYNGEFKIGAITIAPGDGKNLRLRHENVGVERMVAESTIEGYLEDRFFTDKTEADTSEDANT